MAKCCGFGNSYSFIVPSTPPTPITSAVGQFEVKEETGAGTIPAGAYRVEISNIGLGDGTVNGQPWRSGKNSYIAQAWFDEATKTMIYLPAISYDATGTQFAITILKP
jgi:hypothetical protein